jgi:hypothetical protein
MGTARRKRTPGVRVVLVGFPLQGVHRFESPRLSNMSNRLFVLRDYQGSSEFLIVSIDLLF